MSSIIEDIYELKYNPFKYGKYIASFYSTVGLVDENLLLAPLVIPLCSHPVFGKKLKGAVFGPEKQSSMWSTFKERDKLYDLQERIDEFRGLTDLSIQYCLVNDWLAVDAENLSLKYVASSDAPLILQKNAASFGKLVSRHSIIEIYTILGVKLK